MLRHREFLFGAAVCGALALGACVSGPPAEGSFDRTLDVSAPVVLDLSNVSGNVDIRGSTDGKMHIHAEVRASGFGFESPRKRVNEVLASPPVEQNGGRVRVGKELHSMRNVSISYDIEVPHNTEVDTSLVSGSETVRDVRGPVKSNSVSGSVSVSGVERDAQLNTVSGSLDVRDVGGEVRAGSISGSVNISAPKGDVRAHAVSGVIHVVKPGGRVQADSTSGVIEVEGAANDVKASAVSGRISIHGNPVATSYWDLHTTSGTVEIAVPPGANLHLSAQASSGEIRAGVPILVEEQTKHSLRARIGQGGARIQIRTVSGQIEIGPLP